MRRSTMRWIFVGVREGYRVIARANGIYYSPTLQLRSCTQRAVYVKRPGPDQFHLVMALLLKVFLNEPLSTIFNKSLRNVEVTHEWRTYVRDWVVAVIYHSVSLNSVLCKGFKGYIKDFSFVPHREAAIFTIPTWLPSSPFLPMQLAVTCLMDKRHTLNLVCLVF